MSEDSSSSSAHIEANVGDDAQNIIPNIIVGKDISSVNTGDISNSTGLAIGHGAQSLSGCLTG